MSGRRAIVLDVVGLEPEHVDERRAPNLSRLLSDDTGGAHTAMRPTFPALTVPSQTTLATGQSPRTHGDVASGSYDRNSKSVEFWGRERASRTRLWEAASDAGLTTGALFFQHLIGSTADVAITPAPIEDENNDLIEMNCWTNPEGFYEELQQEYGHFPLHNYWGPAANEESTRWILDAARESIARYDPDLLWVYLPHLDYDRLRDGSSERVEKAVATVDSLVGSFLRDLQDDDRWQQTVVNVVSEYGFNQVETPVFPNRALRAAGYQSVATDDTEGDGGPDVDLDDSAAFAVVDHQVAHVYADEAVLDEVEQLLAGLPGVDQVLDEAGKREYGIDHSNAGDLVLVAERDAWFQYYWWLPTEEPPAYARTVDIHAKPGFDPCELFLSDDGDISLEATRIRGSHGRVDPEAYAVYGLGGPAAPDVDFDGPVDMRHVAPTLAHLLGIEDDLEMEFEAPPLT